MSATDRAVDPQHYVTFNKARRFLEAAGLKVKRAAYSHTTYFVRQGDTEWVCNMWDVINMAEERGMQC